MDDLLPEQFQLIFIPRLRHWDTLAGLSHDFIWDFIRQLLFYTVTNTILANKGLKNY